MSLTVVIATRNENPPRLLQTINSIRETSHHKAKIVVVDDCSTTSVAQMLQNSGARFVTMKHSVGCGPARHIGVLNADTEYVALFDSHMLCVSGWYEQVMYRMIGRVKTIHCGLCIGLDREHPTPDKSTSFYYGGTLNISGPDRQDSSKQQVMEAIWNKPGVKDDDEICCCLGACYFMRRDWFLQLNALPYLRTIGQDEVQLSVKSWLAGGDVRFIETAKIGHRFLSKGERQPFSVPPGHTTWNKMLSVLTLCDSQTSDRLFKGLKETVVSVEWDAAMPMLRRDWQFIAAEQALNKSLFQRNLKWLADRFGLNFS